MLRLHVLAVLVVACVTACPAPSSDELGGRLRIPSADQVDAPSRGVEPVLTVTEERLVNGLEAEVAALRRELATGKRDDQLTGLINAHEHLYKVTDLARYLPAARKANVAATVVVASPEFTLKGKGHQGEPSMSENFAVLLDAAQKHPGEIVPFCTVDPKDPDKLSRLEKHIAEGAAGVKIYSGHSNFHDGPLMPPDMEPVLAFLEKNGTPVNWHINLMKFMDEFTAVMTKFPRLNVMVPHYGVVFWTPTQANLDKLSALLTTYPNILVDTSLGTRDILMFGMSAIEPARERFIAFMTKHQDQIIWGTDSVITGNTEKTTGWYSKVIWTTRDHLERDVFFSELGAGHSRYYEKGRDAEGRFQGLSLPLPILQKIYIDNAKRWLHLPATTATTATPTAPTAPTAPTP